MPIPILQYIIETWLTFNKNWEKMLPIIHLLKKCWMILNNPFKANTPILGLILINLIKIIKLYGEKITLQMPIPSMRGSAIICTITGSSLILVALDKLW